MKKVFASLMVFSLLAISSVSFAEADREQVLLSRQCCDYSGNVRCIISNWTPVGGYCYCYYQGAGIVC